MEKKKNEELQSRREFFKKAAKGALPILGAIILAGAPTILKAAQEPITGCDGSCKYTCSGRCDGTCSGSCKTTCSGRCDGTCSGSCKSTCMHHSN